MNRPVAEVYRFWRRLENLPQFMSHLTSVTQTGEKHAKQSHWTATGPAGLPIEWNAEIIHEVLDQTIGWRSLDGSDVVSAGSVNFDARGDRSTKVTVHLQYTPPAGRAGEWIASLLGAVPREMIREDLQRLKALLEKPGSQAAGSGLGLGIAAGGGEPSAPNEARPRSKPQGAPK